MANKLFLSSLAGLSPTSGYAILNADENHATYNWLEAINTGPNISDIPTDMVEAGQVNFTYARVRFIPVYQGYKFFSHFFEGDSFTSIVMYDENNALVWRQQLDHHANDYYGFPNRDEYVLPYVSGGNVRYAVRKVTDNTLIRTVTTVVGNGYSAISGNPANGDIYVAGSATTSTDPHIAVYNSAGTLKWSVNWTNSTGSFIKRILVDSTDGSCFVMSSDTTQAYQTTGFHTVKFSSTGDYLWGDNRISAGADIDSSGNIYAVRFATFSDPVGIIKLNSNGVEQYVSTVNNNTPYFRLDYRRYANEAFSLVLTPDETKLVFASMAGIFVFDAVDGSIFTDYAEFGQSYWRLNGNPGVYIRYIAHDNTFFISNFASTTTSAGHVSTGRPSLSSFDTVTGQLESLPPNIDIYTPYANLVFDPTNSILALCGLKRVDTVETLGSVIRANKAHTILADAPYRVSIADENLTSTGVIKSEMAIHPTTGDIYIVGKLSQSIDRRLLTVYSSDLSSRVSYEGYDFCKKLWFTSDGYLYAFMRHIGNDIWENDVCLYDSNLQLQWVETITTTSHSFVVYQDDIITCHNGATSTDRVISRYRKTDKNLEWSTTISIGNSNNTALAIDSATGVLYIWAQGSTTIYTVNSNGSTGPTYTCLDSILVHSAYFDANNKVLILLGLFRDYMTMYAFDMANLGATLWSKSIADEGVPFMFSNMTTNNNGLGDLQVFGTGDIWYDSWPVKDNLFMLSPPTDLQVSSISDTQATVSWTWSQT